MAEALRISAGLPILTKRSLHSLSKLSFSFSITIFLGVTGGCFIGWNTVFVLEVEVVSRSGRGDTYSQFYLRQ